jgi:hypothetical protein
MIESIKMECQEFTLSKKYLLEDINCENRINIFIDNCINGLDNKIRFLIEKNPLEIHNQNLPRNKRYKKKNSKRTYNNFSRKNDSLYITKANAKIRSSISAFDLRESQQLSDKCDFDSSYYEEDTNQKNEITESFDEKTDTSICESETADKQLHLLGVKKMDYILPTKIDYKITHFIDFTKFYVRDECQTKLFDEFEESLIEWCSKNEKQLDKYEITTLNRNDKVIVVDCCIPVFLISSISKPISKKIRYARAYIKDIFFKENVKMFNCFLIDYGLEALCQESDLKIFNLSEELSQVKSTILKCFLYNLKPYYPLAHKLTDTKSKDQDEAPNKVPFNTIQLIFFHQWINGKTDDNLRIITECMDSSGDYCYGVDLISNLTKSRLRNSLENQSSLCDSFVRCKLAKYDKINDIHLQYRPPILDYTDMGMLTNESRIKVSVGYLDHISGFYLKKIYGCDFYDRLILELTKQVTKFYEDDKSEYKVLSPYEGAPVAARFIDQNLHRAQILKINPEKLTAEISFVDYGNKETVNLNQLYYLTEEFLTNEVTTFRCTLFGIEFKDEKNYSNACDYITETIKPHMHSKVYEIEAQIKKINAGITKNSVIDLFSYEIILRYPIKSVLTNINVALIKLGFADCKDVSIFSGEPEENSLYESPFFYKKEAPTKLESQVNACISNAADQYATENLLPRNSVLCKVTNAVSPSEIWVHVQSSASFQGFQRILAEKYDEILNKNSNNNCETEPVWRKGDICVVRVSSNVFYRAKIVEKLKNSKYKLLCLDDGSYLDDVAESKLKELIEELKRVEYCARKCCLAGVLPMGDKSDILKGEWAFSTNRYVREHLDDNVVYVNFLSDTKVENTDHYEVIVYVKSTKNQLDHYVKLSNLLNQAGLAMLTENKQGLEILEATKFKSSKLKLLEPLNSNRSYPCASIPKIIEKNLQKLNDVTYDAIVTYVAKYAREKKLFYVQLLKISRSYESLFEMSVQFEKFYGTIDELEAGKYGFSPDYIQKRLKKPENLACVCKIDEHFFRCTIVKMIKEKYLVKLVDYGDKKEIDLKDIYRPLSKYVQMEELAFKMRLNTDAPIKPDLPEQLDSLLTNKMVKLKVDIIYDGDDEIILIGDVYELSKGIWIMDELGIKSSLNNSKVEIDNFFQMDHEIRPYELVDSCFSSDRRKDSTQKIFSILVTWVEDVDNIWVRLVNRKQPEFLSKVVTSSMEIHRTQKAFEKMQNQFGPSVESKSLEKMKLTNIYEKKYCVCLRENEYFRALILNVDYRLFKADIKYIDFGDNENVSFNRIYDLHDCYYTMPTNTFACKLKDYEINY